jgi:hypothetical protein
VLSLEGSLCGALHSDPNRLSRAAPFAAAKTLATVVCGLGSSRSTIELHPPDDQFYATVHRANDSAISCSGDASRRTATTASSLEVVTARGAGTSVPAWGGPPYQRRVRMGIRGMLAPTFGQKSLTSCIRAVRAARYGETKITPPCH